MGDGIQEDERRRWGRWWCGMSTGGTALPYSPTRHDHMHDHMHCGRLTHSSLKNFHKPIFERMLLLSRQMHLLQEKNIENIIFSGFETICIHKNCMFFTLASKGILKENRDSVACFFRNHQSYCEVH